MVGMVGMPLYYSLLLDLSVFSMKVSDIILVCGLMLTQLGRLLLASSRSSWRAVYGIADTWFFLFDDGLYAAAAESVALPLMTLRACCCP